LHPSANDPSFLYHQQLMEQNNGRKHFCQSVALTVYLMILAALSGV
jgi:hypothetical protein